MLILTCSRCRIPKPENEFHRGSGPWGRRQPCRKCRADDNILNRRIKPPWECVVCGSPSNRRGTSGYCRVCHRVKYYPPEKKRDLTLIQRYGITQKDFTNMSDRQGGVCAICKRSGVRIVVDHCHLTSKVRGLLCDKCNQTLSIWKDDPEIAHRAFCYLRDQGLTN